METKNLKSIEILNDFYKVYRVSGELVAKFFRGLIVDEIEEVIGKYSFWLAGGCLREFMESKKLSRDIDIYFYSQDKRRKLMHYFYENGGHYEFKGKNSIVMSYKGLTLDLIKLQFDDIPDYLRKTDFLCNMIALENDYLYYVWGNHTYKPVTTLMSISNKKLYLNKEALARHGVAKILRRILKFVAKGYIIEDDELNQLLLFIYNRSNEEKKFAKTDSEDGFERYEFNKSNIEKEEFEKYEFNEDKEIPF